MGKNPTRKEILVFRYTMEVMSRRESWRGRWGADIQKLRRDYCNQCRRVKYCRRLWANEYIRRMMSHGDDCPDMYPIWERVLNGTEHM